MGDEQIYEWLRWREGDVLGMDVAEDPGNSTRPHIRRLYWIKIFYLFMRGCGSLVVGTVPVALRRMSCMSREMRPATAPKVMSVTATRFPKRTQKMSYVDSRLAQRAIHECVDRLIHIAATQFADAWMSHQVHHRSPIRMVSNAVLTNAPGIHSLIRFIGAEV